MYELWGRWETSWAEGGCRSFLRVKGRHPRFPGAGGGLLGFIAAKRRHFSFLGADGRHRNFLVTVGGDIAVSATGRKDFGGSFQQRNFQSLLLIAALLILTLCQMA